MKRWIGLLSMLIGAAVVLPVVTMGQQESLGDLARQLRAERQKSGEKPAKLYTNDNLPIGPAQQGATATPGTSSPPSEGPAGSQPDAAGIVPQAPSQPSTVQGPAAGEQSAVPQESAGEEMRTEAYWQGKFKVARANLARAREVQQLVEDELNLLQIQEARELNLNAKQTLGAKVESKQTEVEAKRAATAKAEQALQDLEKEFKESAAPEEWSRTGEQPNQ